MRGLSDEYNALNREQQAALRDEAATQALLRDVLTPEEYRPLTEMVDKPLKAFEYITAKQIHFEWQPIIHGIGYKLLTMYKEGKIVGEAEVGLKDWEM